MEHETRKKEIVKATLVGSVVNLFLLAFKFAAGIFGRSSAMIADAVHSLSDFATDIVVLVCIRISTKPRDEDHHYGHGKYETLATAIIGIILFFVGLSLMWNGADKIIGFWFRGETLTSPGMIALIAALVSIVSKEILYHYTKRVGKRVNSQSVIANAWHHRSDALSSVGTALGIGGAILLGPKWNVLDPLAAVVVSVFILKVAVQLIRPAIDELLEKSLPPEQEKEILDIVLSIPGVSDPHNLRTRRIGSECAIELHVRADDRMTVTQAHILTKEIEEKLRKKYGTGTFITVHVEPRK